MISINEKDIIDYYKNGASLQDTANKFSLVKNRVKDILIKNNTLRTKAEVNALISEKCKKLSGTYTIDWQGLVNYYKAGNSISACATKFNTKSKRVENYLSENNILRSDEENKLLAIEKTKAKNNLLYGVDWPCQNKTILAKSENTCLEKYGFTNQNKNKGVREKYKTTCLEKYGVENVSQTGAFHTGRSVYEYGDIKFDSLPELALWVYAIDHNEQIKREPIRLKYIFEGKDYYCIPDFEYKGELVEIKGDHLINESGEFYNPYNPEDLKCRAKYKCLITNGVKIITTSGYKIYLDYFNKHYNKEEFRRKKND